jgi:hypothetical protein
LHESLLKLRDELIVLESAASAGGSATETMVFEGLREDDEVMSLSQRVPGASGGAPVGYASQVADGLDVSWDADPGAGAVLMLLVRRKMLL